MNTATYLFRYKTINVTSDSNGIPDDSIPPYSNWHYQIFRIPWDEPLMNVIGRDRLPSDTIAEVMQLTVTGLLDRFEWTGYFLTTSNGWIPNIKTRR